jgi:hypothetical protein
VLAEYVFRVAGARVEQRSADAADGIVPAADEFVAAASGSCLKDAQLGVFGPAPLAPGTTARPRT